MPDLGAILALLLVGGLAALVVAWPAAHRAAVRTQASIDTAELRHRMALAALRDVEADRRAGSLDDDAYATQRAEAEATAAATLAALDAAPDARTEAETRATEASSHAGRRTAAVIGAALGVALLVGIALPPPIGFGERTVIDQALADALQTEADRQAEIARLLDLVAADPTDATLLSDLADAYLAGNTARDLERGAVTLQLLMAVDPGNLDAYRRLITAYIRADDWTDARAATDAYAGLAPSDDADLAFFEGLIAWRGEGDADAALAAFDRFLALAPEDPRAAMIRALRAEAAGEPPAPSAG